MPEPSPSHPRPAPSGPSNAALPDSAQPGSEPFGPRPGDVVVGGGELAPAWTLSVYPGSPQLTCPSRAMALNMARTLVRRQRVDSWLDRGGAAFVVLERHP